MNRRDFIKAATLLGIGTMTAGSLKTFANAPQEKPVEKGIGTILTKKRSLGSKKNPLGVSNTTGLHGYAYGSWYTP